nr:MAG TPA: RNA polymerase [Bacteriophage sp.]
MVVITLIGNYFRRMILWQMESMALLIELLK